MADVEFYMQKDPILEFHILTSVWIATEKKTDLALTHGWKIATANGTSSAQRRLWGTLATAQCIGGNIIQIRKTYHGSTNDKKRGQQKVISGFLPVKRQEWNDCSPMQGRNTHLLLYVHSGMFMPMKGLLSSKHEAEKRTAHKQVVNGRLRAQDI